MFFGHRCSPPTSPILWVTFQNPCEGQRGREHGVATMEGIPAMVHSQGRDTGFVKLTPCPNGWGLDPVTAALPDFLPYPRIWFSLKTPAQGANCPSAMTLTWHNVTTVMDELPVTQEPQLGHHLLLHAHHGLNA